MSIINPGSQRRVMSFHYTLKDESGQILDASEESEPLAFLEGAGQIIPALEEEIAGMLIGQKKTVKLSADKAYGNPEPKLVMDVPKDELAHLKIEVGAFLQLDLGNQLKVVRVTRITDKAVTLDGNHPLAGQNLVFDVEMVDSRAATTEELAHGHAHGPGGHHH